MEIPESYLAQKTNSQLKYSDMKGNFEKFQQKLTVKIKTPYLLETFASIKSS